ncbi:Nlrc3, partial [Symbiodinium necroappetens]
EGLLSCADVACRLRHAASAPEPQEAGASCVCATSSNAMSHSLPESKSYDLAEKQGLADFLKDADIRLVHTPGCSVESAMLERPAAIRSCLLCVIVNVWRIIPLTVLLREAMKCLAQVRADFILKLHREGQRLPRRQEAESAYVDCRTALVTHEEVQVWADGKAPAGTKVVSLSHCWESREHCDPYGYQVSKLAEALKGEEWVFIDY